MWIGFCQKRRFWLQNKKKFEINFENINDYLLKEIPEEWKNYDAIICEPIRVEVNKISKLIEKGGAIF